MKSFVFVSDLDGTLIHSRRNYRLGDLEVESIEGEPRGFIRPIVLSALEAFPDDASFAVATTRSTSQYKRLTWINRAPDLAYVANGGLRYAAYAEEATLLFAETANWANCLNMAVGLIGGVNEVKAARVVDGCYALALLEDPRVIPAVINRIIFDLGLRLFIEGKKVYLFPEGLEKSLAIEDLRTMHPGKKIICAGDSTNDLPMLRVADIAITTQVVAEKLAELGTAANVIVCATGNPLEDFVGQWLKEFEESML